VTETHPGSSTVAAVSNALVALHKEQYGRGPTKARTYFAGPDVMVNRLGRRAASRRKGAGGDGRVRAGDVGGDCGGSSSGVRPGAAEAPRRLGILGRVLTAPPAFFDTFRRGSLTCGGPNITKTVNKVELVPTLIILVFVGFVAQLIDAAPSAWRTASAPPHSCLLRGSLPPPPRPRSISRRSPPRPLPAPLTGAMTTSTGEWCARWRSRASSAPSLAPCC
jgi:hypothetical protein